jgi:hypothetical protein
MFIRVNGKFSIIQTLLYQVFPRIYWMDILDGYIETDNNEMLSREPKNCHDKPH